MNHDYDIVISVRVHDKKALYDAAKERAILDGIGRVEMSDYIGTRRKPDVGGCLQMLLDPGISPDGCDIQQSSVTSY